MHKAPITPLSIHPTAAQQRQALRLLMRQQRAQLTHRQQQQEALLLCHQLLAVPALQNAQHIALYSPFDGEIDTQPLCQRLWQERKQLYLPKLNPQRPGELLFLPYTRETQLQRNQFGILEPLLALDTAFPIAQLAVVLLPVVAFDIACHRLGMGGGYYDRTLNTHHHTDQGQQPLVMIGLAHDCQRVDSLPRASWDRRLTAVITPRHLFST